MVGGCKEASVFLDLLSVATPNWFVSVICIFQADKECSLSYIIGADTVEELDVNNLMEPDGGNGSLARSLGEKFRNKVDLCHIGG
jgi:hypothetical protein